MWDERYSQTGYAYGDAPNDFLVEVADRLPGGRVLCLAEGQGRNATFLAAQGHEVTAMDISPVGLKQAEAMAAERGVQIKTEVADLATYEIAPGAWSGIVSIWAHTPPDVRRRVHGQVATGLEVGGVFILEAYTPAQVGRGTGGPPVPELAMSLDGLRDELPGLDFEIGRELEREVREGKYHNGLSAVVQVVARRRS